MPGLPDSALQGHSCRSENLQETASLSSQPLELNSLVFFHKNTHLHWFGYLP